MRRRRKLGGEYEAQGDVFECYDDAGYTNVNQCMKFSAKTAMRTATFRDLSLGRHQATLVEYPLSGYFDESDHYRRDTWGTIGTYFFLSLATVGLLGSCFCCFRTCQKVRSEEGKGGSSDDNDMNTTSDSKRDSLLSKKSSSRSRSKS